VMDAFFFGLKTDGCCFKPVVFGSVQTFEVFTGHCQVACKWK
jgi:hypothetical protein